MSVYRATVYNRATVPPPILQYFTVLWVLKSSHLPGMLVYCNSGFDSGKTRGEAENDGLGLGVSTVRADLCPISLPDVWQQKYAPNYTSLRLRLLAWKTLASVRSC